MLRAVEGHVLEEVSQTTLVLVLLNGAYTLCNVEVGYMLRPLVVADVVGQTVGQLADAHVLVDGDRRHLLRCSHCCHEHKRYYEKVFNSHNSSYMIIN